MSKRQKQSHRKPHHVHPGAQSERQPPGLETTLRDATKLIEGDQPQKAVYLLKLPSLQYSRVAPLHHTLAAAHLALGDLWARLAGFERALDLSSDPRSWEPLAHFYFQL